MLLAIDIGNSSIKFGVFNANSLVKKFSIPSQRDHTPGTINDAAAAEIDTKVDTVIVCSVVPELDAAVSGFASHFLKTEARFVKTTDDLGLTFNYPTETTGTDRLVNSFAAAEKYGEPCIVCSFGTATTIDAVTRSREHLGGLIAPGMPTSAKSLKLNTSKLPEIEIIDVPGIIGTSTDSCIRSGIYYSQVGLVEIAVRKMKGRVGDIAKVIATGGFAELIAQKSPSIDKVDADLTLNGLRLLHKLRLRTP